MPGLTREIVRRLVRDGRYACSLQAERGRQEAEVTTAELEHAMLEGEIVDVQPKRARRQSFVVLGFATGRPIHVICALARRRRQLLLLTVI